MNLRIAHPFRALASALLIPASLAISACGGGDNSLPDATEPVTTLYGALAVNATTLASGIAYDYSSQTAADQSAVAQCGGGPCGVVQDMVGAGACASYATSSNRAWGASVGASLAQAQTSALATCSVHGGTGCTTQLSACN